MMQVPLFIEDLRQALEQIVVHAGGPKVVGPKLWPLKSVEEARGALLDALNPHRREKLDLEQIERLLLIGREAGFHGAKHYLDDATGYRRSEPADPKVETDRAAEAVAEAAAALSKAMQTLDRLQARNNMRAA